MANGEGMTKKSRQLKRRERSELKQRMFSFLMFLPNLVILLGRLLKDRRVPMADKTLFVAALVYFVSPIDLIPDIFPFVGQIDDLYLISLTLLRLINRTDDTIVRQLWPGNGDIVALADSFTHDPQWPKWKYALPGLFDDWFNDNVSGFVQVSRERSLRGSNSPLRARPFEA